MKNFLEQSATLREKLTRVKSLGADEQLVRTWQPLIAGLPDHFTRLEELISVFRLFHQNKLLPDDRSLTPTGLDKLLKELEAMRDKLRNKPDKVMQKSGWAKADATLKKFADLLEGSLMDIWKEYLGAAAPRLDDLTPFFQDGRLGEEIAEIENLQRDLKRLELSLPDADGAIRDVEVKGRKIHRLVKKLDFGEIPPAVKSFIQKVASGGGVPLEDLDDKVFAWLREKNLLQAFRVQMGRR
ncbi:MAG: hypothetical protein ACI8UO_003229 [Verrucomicrobiales bacterium]|jgi:hypothetical protein